MKKSIILMFIIFIIINFSGCGKEKSTIQHFSKSIDYANQATQLQNKGSLDEFMNLEDSEKMFEFLKKALEEARLVDIETLNRHYPGFGNHYRDEFISGLGLFIEGSEKHDNTMLLTGQVLCEKWDEWYEQNIDAIRKRK